MVLSIGKTPLFHDRGIFGTPEEAFDQWADYLALGRYVNPDSEDPHAHFNTYECPASTILTGRRQLS